MKFVLTLSSIAMVFYVAHACVDNRCKHICAAEIKDPTNQLTFKKKSELDKFNENFEKPDEKFEFVHDGKCKVPEVCPEVESKICALPEIGACGEPKCFKNFCELNKHNAANPTAEYEYYHDDDCNDVSAAVADDCSCLECEKEVKWAPVCALPADPCGRPVTFSNNCWLQKFNCDVPLYQFNYFHEGACYTDEIEG